MDKIAIIDLDSLSFAIGNPNKILDEFGVPKRTEDDSKFLYEDKTEEELENSADFMMNSLLENGNFTSYIAFIKGKDTIKHKREIDPNYKADRNVKEKPKWWDFVKNYLINKWNAVEVNNIEVDDAVNIARLAIPNSFICAIDSDLLCLEGTHFNWKKNEWVTTTEMEAYYKFWSDMICGTHNNVKGLKGKGKAFVDKLFSTNSFYPEAVLSAYIGHFNNIDEAITEFYKNYKLLKILDKYQDFDISKININLVNKNIF